MIRAQIDGTEYTVHFRHQQLREPVPWGERLIRGRTSASVENQGEEVGFGMARCSAGDIFCRETGRKLAMARALKDLDKPVRTAIWQAYFQRTNGKGGSA